MNFSKQQVEQLETLLDNENYPDALNYQECHGFLCALKVGPINIDSEQRNQIIFFGDEPAKSTVINQEAIELIGTLQQEIENTLFSAETLLLPCSLQLEDAEISESLEDWILGFFEGLMIDEASWYNADENISAEMLMPFLLCLEGLDEEEILSIRNKEALFQTVILQIPQALQDLYLYFHVNDA